MAQKIKTVLISQPKPSTEKSPYFDLAERQKLTILERIHARIYPFAVTLTEKIRNRKLKEKITHIEIPITQMQNNNKQARDDRLKKTRNEKRLKQIVKKSKK